MSRTSVFSHWLRSLRHLLDHTAKESHKKNAGSLARKEKRLVRPYQPIFDCLEDRVTPSTLTVGAALDNSIFSESPNNSDGASYDLFTGRTNQSGGAYRRSLIEFDLSALPSGAVIDSVSLTMVMSGGSPSGLGAGGDFPQGYTGPLNISLDRVLTSWGAGSSGAGTGNGGSVAPGTGGPPGGSGGASHGFAATSGDATWTYNSFDTSTWTTPGGDFVSTPSATASADINPQYVTWSSPGLVNDVQGWVNNPTTNFGWEIVGDESTNGTSRLFVSSESPNIAYRPALTIVYNAPSNISAGGPYTIDAGNNLTLNGSAINPSGNTLSYSWDINGDGTYGDATGANPTLTWAQLNALGIVAPGAINNISVQVSDGTDPAVTSSPTTLTINPALSIGTQPASASIDNGQNDTLSVAAANGTPGYTYQWYIGTSGDITTPIGGATSFSYAAAPTSTTSYWVQVTDSVGASIDSSAATITVNPAITLSSTTQALFVTSYVTNAVYEFDASTGALLKTLVAPNSQSILMGPAGVTVGPDGNLYITGEGYDGSSFTGPYNIVEYNFSTQTLSTFISGAQLQAANGGVPFAPGGIAFGPDGNLYTDNTLPGAGADQVIRFGITNNDGQLSYNGTNMTIATGLSVACDITFGANPGDQGNLYVSDDNSVLKITGATTNSPTSSLFVSPGSGGLTYSCGLIWQGGNLYDTDPGSGQVLEYSDTGSFVGDFTGSALQNPNQQPINTLFLPDGDVVTSAFGPGSGFLVGTQGNEAGSLMQFNSSGQFLQNLGAGAFPASPTTGVTGVALAFMTLDTTAPAAESTVVLAQDTVGVPYDQTLTANGGTGSVSLAVTNIVNPAGLTIPTGGTGSLSIGGTPTTPGTVTFTVTATDSLGATTTTDYSITVNPAITLSPATLPADTVNVPYSMAITAAAAEDTFYANQVVSYVPGVFDTIPGAVSETDYDDPTAALGGLNPIIGNFGGAISYLTPFNPAFSASDLVEIGAGGSIVLKLAETASTDGDTIGVHTGFGLLDMDYPNGTNSDPASYFVYWLRQANVMVSADGSNWGDLGTVAFDNPSNIDSGAATDPEGNSPGVGPAADPGKPFLGSLSSFNGEDWQQTLAALDGSAGGTWLNLTGVTDENGNPISGVNYIKFSVPGSPPLDPNTGNPEIMMIDAVVGTNSASTITPSGGTGAVTLAVTNVQNAIPGLNVPSSGAGSLAITGSPSAPGTETFTVTATDSLGATTTTDYSITANPAIALSPSALPDGAFNAAYSQVIAPSGGTGDVTLTVSGIINPLPGLSIPANGVDSLAITGTPTVAGTETFMVTATDALGGTTGPVPYSITVTPAGTLTLSPVALTPGAVGASYGPITFSASGGSGAYAFKLATGNRLPAGLTLSTAGVLSGTPSSAGTFTFTIVASDRTTPGLTGQLKYSMLVTPALAVSPVALPVGTAGDAFSVQLQATGGSGSGYVFTSGALPAGLSLTSVGLLSGIPTIATGTPFHFIVTVTDSNNVSHDFDYALAVDPAIAITTGTLPVATVGNPFSTQLTATGGSGRGYVFRSTALPAWLTLSRTGLLSGTPPATAGSLASFTVTVTDSVKGNDSTSYTLSVDPALVLSPTTLTVVTVGNPFSTQLTAAGGSGLGYTFTGLHVPAWMTVSSTGLISGTPTTALGSPFHFGVIATDSEGGRIGHTYTLSVNPAPAILPVTLPVATVGNNFSVQLRPIGGSGMGYVFSSSSMPAWLTLSSNGLLSGMPPSTTGSPLNFSLTLTDSNSVSRTFNYALTIDPAVTVTTATLPVATVGDHFGTQLIAAGGSGSGYAFTGVGLPAWLNLSRTGLLTGTPPATAGSSVSFMIKATDNLKGAGGTSLTLTIDPALVLSPTTLTVVTVDNFFSTQLTAAGASGLGYTFAGLHVPGWMTVSSTGLITGTPTTSIGSPFHFGVVVTDSDGGTIGHTYTLNVNPAPAILPVTLPVATVGDAFNLQLRATAGSRMGYVFSSSNLPAWLTLSSNGFLSGTPTDTIGSPLNFTISLTDSNGAVGNRAFTLTVDPALTLSPGTLPLATVGSHFSTQLTAGGGSNAGYTFTAVNLPAGLTLSRTGLLSGTPRIATSTPSLIGTPFSFTVTATDNKGGTTSRTYSLTVDSALVIQPTTLLPATVGNAFSTQLSVSGGSGLGYAFTAVRLPAGLTLSSAGFLSGTPTSAVGSPIRFTVIATDSTGASTSRVFALTVRPALVFHPASLPVAKVNQPFSIQLTASGGSGSGYLFAAISLPNWLSLAGNGVLTGTPPSTAGSPLQLVVEVIDSTGATGTHTYNLTVLV